MDTHANISRSDWIDLKRTELEYPFSRRTVWKWVPDRKIWRISDEYATAAIRLLREHFEVRDLSNEEKKEEKKSSTHNADAYTVLYLLLNAPEELIKAAYRCLAMLYHPDRGGDVTRMQALNRAYEELGR